jgi:uncharacterized membrane protein
VKTTWRVELPQILLLLAMFVTAAAVWNSAPDQIPVHWNGAGEIDRYGGRFEGLLLLPLIATGIYLLLRFLPNIDPGRANYARFGGTYAAIRIGVIALSAAIYGVAMLWVVRRPVSIKGVVPILVGVLFVVLGSVMGKIRPNWFVGIRTPWTMSSKIAWVRTHRLGGWLFLAQGVLFIVSGALDNRILNGVVIGTIFAVIATLFVYSYVLWRADPEKLPPTGTQPADEE